MSDTRQTDNVGAVDQAARAAQQPTEQQQPEVVATQEDVIADLKRQLEEREAGDRAREAEQQRLREQAADERRGREAAEARARQAEQRAQTEAQTGRRTAEDAQLDAINAGIDSHKGKLSALEDQLAAAMAEGDFKKSAKVQSEIGFTTADIRQLEAGKNALEARKATRNAEQQQPNGRDAGPEGGQTETERREAFIRQQPSLIQGWLRQNGERYFGDPILQQDIAAAARIAQRRGIPGDSQDFIDFIEENVGMRQQQARREQQPAGGGDAAPARQQSQNRMVTAPAGGSTPGTGRSDAGTSVYLTAAERSIARSLDMTDADYAKHKAELLKEGLIGPEARNR